MHQAVAQYVAVVGIDQPLQQWILSDYDSWEPNPYYIGPDLGHPEYGDPLGAVYATLKEAKKAAIEYSGYTRKSVKVSHHKPGCWVVWY